MKIIKSIFISLLRDSDIQHELSSLFKKISLADKNRLSTVELANSEIDINLPQNNKESGLYSERIAKVKVIDPLREQLKTILELVAIFEQDAELTQRWLGEYSKNEGENILRITAISSNWDRLENLWELLAERCKNQQRAASDAELKLLNSTLSIHNLLWKTRLAELVHVGIGTSYNYENQQRANPKGEQVSAVWLPGLRNNAGALRKKSLVETV